MAGAWESVVQKYQEATYKQVSLLYKLIVMYCLATYVGLSIDITQKKYQ